MTELAEVLDPALAGPPVIDITWYDSPEGVHRALWEQVARAEGMSYDELMADSELAGITADGEEITISHSDEMAAMRAQGVWGWIDTGRNHIHAWAEPHTDPVTLIHMLAHEIGHATGTPNRDELLEELRCEQFGRVAAQALRLLQQAPNHADRAAAD